MADLRPLNQVLGDLPSGLARSLSDEDVGKRLRAVIHDTTIEKRRRDEIRRRVDLYNDNCIVQMSEMIDRIFSHAEMQREAKAYLEYATFQNVLRRVSDELGNTYQENAVRTVQDNQQDTYDELLAMVGLDDALRRADRYVTFSNEVLVWYRVDAHTNEPKLHVLTQDQFWAVPHPNDSTRVAAIVFDLPDVEGAAAQPRYEVWTDFETMLLSQHGHIMSETRMEHGYGTIPGVLVHRERPTERLLDWTSGKDLVAAHKAAGLLNVLMLRESALGTKVPFVAGDIGNTATGQLMDRGSLSVFQEGVAPGTLDLGSDPNAYILAARSVIKQVAANYGIPESVFDLSYQATSGFEIELKRVGLREKRRQRVMYPWRPAERQLAAVMSAVNARHLPAFGFSTSEWSINFAESETPQDPMQRLLVWEKERTMGLRSTLQMVKSMNPEFNDKLAEEFLADVIVSETDRVETMNDLKRENASTSTSVDDNLPEENGEDGRNAGNGGGFLQ